MKHLFAFVLICSATFAIADEPASQPQLPEKENFHLFLLIGQSNMAGRGTVEASDKEAHPRVLAFTKANEWDYARDPLHFDKPIAGVGLGRTFGLEVAKAHGLHVRRTEDHRGRELVRIVARGVGACAGRGHGTERAALRARLVRIRFG